MDIKKALDILIAVAICEPKRKNRFECVECPLHTYDEECNSTCEPYTDKELDEAIRLLKNVKVLDPNPDLSGEWVLAKMLKVPESNTFIVPANSRYISVSQTPSEAPPEVHSTTRLKCPKEISERDKAYKRLKKRFGIN